MSIFRRHKHTWEVKATQTFPMQIWAKGAWHDVAPDTIIRYVCGACQADKSRRVKGEITVAQAKVVFPRP